MNNVRILSGKEQERMCNNGWRIVLSKRGESEQELYDRLIVDHVEVKVYNVTTYVKGYYNTIAMVKGVQL